jgi:alpha-beta hydrolase superfamily lysophospholipase
MEIKNYPSGKTAIYRFDTDDTPGAVILLVHGFGEYAGRYKTWASRFNDTGISVRSFDLPGHGLSEGRRGSMPPPDVIYDTIDTIRSEIVTEMPGVPLIVYGHSLGGLIVLGYLINRKPEVHGAIVTSPWIRLAFEPPKMKELLANIAGKIMPGLTQSSGLKTEYLSRDSEVVAAYRSDPLVHGLISAGMYLAIKDAAKEVLARASEINVPLLLVHGRGDMITSPSGSVDVAAAAPKSTLKLWDGGYHELLNDLIRDEHFDFLVDWINTLL